MLPRSSPIRPAEANHCKFRLEGAVRRAVGRGFDVCCANEVLELVEEGCKLPGLPLQLGPLEGGDADGGAADDHPSLCVREIAVGGADGVEEDANLLVPEVADADTVRAGLVIVLTPTLAIADRSRPKRMGRWEGLQ